MNRELLNILRSDVKPALGCTGPISVAFATAAAVSPVKDGELKALKVRMDRDTYKNSISVATPGTPYMGVLEPAVVGALYGNAEYGLEVLKDLNKGWDQARVEAFAREHTTIEIDWDHKQMGIFIEVFAETDAGQGHAIVAKTHDNVVLLEKDGQVISREEGYDQAADFEKEKPIRAYTIRDIYDFAVETPIEELAFLQEALDANYALAQAGLEGRLGSDFGNGYAKIGPQTPISKAKVLAAAASDARMSGAPLSAMSCGGSGNVGITASISLIPVAEDLNKGKEELLRALAMSYLLTIMGKAHIGRLSPMCACAMVASLGVAAASCYLMGGSFEQIEAAIGNLIGSTGGVLCDGAKYGCAMKLATGIGIAIESAQLAVAGVRIRKLDGLVGNTADETLGMLGRIASKGMLDADEYMCREIIAREGRIKQ